MTLLLNEEEAKSLTSVRAAIPIIEDALRILGERRAYTPPRTRMPTGFEKSKFHEGFLQLGPATIPAKNVVGYKIFANFGDRDPHLRYGKVWNHLFDLETGELLAIMQAHKLSQTRTAAATGVAAKFLSPPTASSVTIFGPGKLAEGQLEAICAVRPIKQVFIYGRNKEKREAFARTTSKLLNVDVRAESSPEEAARKAEIIVTCTSSFEPVLFADWLGKSGLVIGAGANHWNRRELDESIFKTADLVVVDERETAKVESGALLTAVHNGIVTWDQVENLSDVIVNRIRIPDFERSRIVFASHGIAIEDVAISAHVYELAKQRGIGRNVEI